MIFEILKFYKKIQNLCEKYYFFEISKSGNLKGQGSEIWSQTSNMPERKIIPLRAIFPKLRQSSFFQKIRNSHMSLMSLILAELLPICGPKTFCTVPRWWPSVENLLTADGPRWVQSRPGQILPLVCINHHCRPPAGHCRLP